MSTLPDKTDILVIGGGAAGLTAALEARLHPSSPSVLLLDACPEEWAGGNSYFTAGAYRTCHRGLEDLAEIVSNVSNVTKEGSRHDELASQKESGIQKGEEPLKDDKPPSNDTVPASLIDLPPYTLSDFHDDMQRVTSGRCDPTLTATLVDSSWETVKWLHDVGEVDFQLSFRRQAYRVDGRYKFWGGLALTVNGGGKGLVTGLMKRVKEAGVDVRYNAKCTGLVVAPSENTRVTGARIQYTPTFSAESTEGVDNKNLTETIVHSKATILCAGGFEASSSLRSKYLGTNWAFAHVRGTPFNDGSMLSIVQRDCDALPVGDWAGCHAVAWDADAPWERGDREVTNEFTKSGYPLGIMVNIRGERFVDEGVDLRNYTYAKFGRAILEQERGECFQIWDGKTISLLRDEEYRVERVKRYTASTMEELAIDLSKHGLKEPSSLMTTIGAFNQAVDNAEQNGEHQGKNFDPSIRDGISTSDLPLPKSNWALKLDAPPFVAVKVGSGVTFTFGGIKIDSDTAAVIRRMKGSTSTEAVSQRRGPLAHRSNPLQPAGSTRSIDGPNKTPSSALPQNQVEQASDMPPADSSVEIVSTLGGLSAYRSTPRHPPPSDKDSNNDSNPTPLTIPSEAQSHGDENLPKVLYEGDISQARGPYAHRSTPLRPPPSFHQLNSTDKGNEPSSLNPSPVQVQEPKEVSELSGRDPPTEEVQEVMYKNLFCAGEMLGGLFWGNYPGGSGLTSGAIWGRRAGKGAAEACRMTNGF